MIKIQIYQSDSQFNEYAEVQEGGPTDPALPGLDVNLLERAARETLEQAGAASNAEITLVVTGEAQIREFNRQYLGVDAPTDVLAFSNGEIDPDSGEVYLGDVILCYPRAQAQARAGGHAIEAELQLLVVHGVLHLLGHDHAEQEQKSRMWAAQAEILKRLGCEIQMPA